MAIRRIADAVLVFGALMMLGSCNLIVGPLGLFRLPPGPFEVEVDGHAVESGGTYDLGTVTPGLVTETLDFPVTVRYTAEKKREYIGSASYELDWSPKVAGSEALGETSFYASHSGSLITSYDLIGVYDPETTDPIDRLYHEWFDTDTRSTATYDFSVEYGPNAIISNGIHTLHWSIYDGTDDGVYSYSGDPLFEFTIQIDVEGVDPYLQMYLDSSATALFSDAGFAYSVADGITGEILGASTTSLASDGSVASISGSSIGDSGPKFVYLFEAADADSNFESGELGSESSIIVDGAAIKVLSAADFSAGVTQSLNVSSSTASDADEFVAYWLPPGAGPYGFIAFDAGAFASGSAASVFPAFLIPGTYDLYVVIDENSNGDLAQDPPFDGLDNGEYAALISNVEVLGGTTNVSSSVFAQVSGTGPTGARLRLSGDYGGTAVDNESSYTPVGETGMYMLPESEYGYLYTDSGDSGRAVGFYISGASDSLDFAVENGGGASLGLVAPAGGGTGGYTFSFAGGNANTVLEAHNTSSTDNAEFDVIVRDGMLGGTTGAPTDLVLNTPTGFGADFGSEYFRFTAAASSHDVVLTDLTAGVDISIEPDGGGAALASFAGNESDRTKTVTVTGLTPSVSYLIKLDDIVGETSWATVGVIEVQN